MLVFHVSIGEFGAANPDVLNKWCMERFAGGSTVLKEFDPTFPVQEQVAFPNESRFHAINQNVASPNTASIVVENVVVIANG